MWAIVALWATCIWTPNTGLWYLIKTWEVCHFVSKVSIIMYFSSVALILCHKLTKVAYKCTQAVKCIFFVLDLIDTTLNREKSNP